MIPPKIPVLGMVDTLPKKRECTLERNSGERYIILEVDTADLDTVPIVGNDDLGECLFDTIRDNIVVAYPFYVDSVMAEEDLDENEALAVEEIDEMVENYRASVRPLTAEDEEDWTLEVIVQELIPKESITVLKQCRVSG